MVEEMGRERWRWRSEGDEGRVEIGKGWKRGEEVKGRARWRCVEMGWGQVEWEEDVRGRV